MPLVKRSVEQEVSHNELIADLKKYVKESNVGKVCFRNEDGSYSNREIEVGDVLIPKESLYDRTNIVPGTYALVVATIPFTGLIHAVYHNKATHEITSGFFDPLIFEDKFQPNGRAPKAAQKRKAKR